jgi:hypothetical protein
MGAFHPTSVDLEAVRDLVRGRESSVTGNATGATTVFWFLEYIQ